jgi:hypothetical protein
MKALIPVLVSDQGIMVDVSRLGKMLSSHLCTGTWTLGLRRNPDELQPFQCCFASTNRQCRPSERGVINHVLPYRDWPGTLPNARQELMVRSGASAAVALGVQAVFRA